MNQTINILLLGGMLASLAIALGVYLTGRYRMARMLRQLNRMFDAAMDGSFCETQFDESQLSALETKVAHYLSASEVSARNLAEEKNKIKELIADISHQTKTPIANILLYAQLLREQEISTEGRTCVEALNAQAEKLNFLIGALVKTSRLETGIMVFNPKKAAVWPMLVSVQEQLTLKLQKKSIHLFMKETELEAVFDGKWTTEAIYNIVDNAVKYTPEGGNIQIKAAAYDLFVRIDIMDNGIGIEEEEQSKIFGRFYRTKEVNQEEGVGIGLYLSRQIISQEGGYIKVASKQGQGSTFSVFLPKE